MMIGNPRKVVQFLLPTAFGDLRRPRDFWIGWYAIVGHWGHVRASGVAHATSVGVWRRLAVIQPARSHRQGKAHHPGTFSEAVDF